MPTTCCIQYNSNSDNTGDTWSDESLDEFKDITHCGQWRPIMAKVLQPPKAAGEVPVLQLVDTSRDEVKDIRFFIGYVLS